MISIKGKLNENKVDAEIDDYGEFSTIEASGSTWEAKVNKSKTDKEEEREKYYYTGIQQVGTSYPNPYMRDQLIKLRFANKTLIKHPAFAIAVTIIAIVVDVVCYGLLIEENIPANEQMQLSDYLPAIGAAIAIDFLPMFLAQNLHRINISRKKVIKIFGAFSLALIIVFLIIILVYRIFALYFNTNSHIVKLIWAIFMVMIPIATTTMCFIVNYISFNPLQADLKRLENQELFVQENVFEIQAMLEEAKAMPNYKEELILQDNALYESACDLIETIGEYYKSYIRTEIIPTLHSPADTTDLSADRNISPVKSISLPIINISRGDIK